MRIYTIACVRTGQKNTTIESSKFAFDICKEFYPDIVGNGQLVNLACYRFYSLQFGYILVSWESGIE